jgi:hypothetical protein
VLKPLQGDACVQCAGRANVVACFGKDADQHTDGRFVSAGIPPQGVPSAVHKIIGIGHAPPHRGASDVNRAKKMMRVNLVFCSWGVSSGFSGGARKCYDRA